MKPRLCPLGRIPWLILTIALLDARAASPALPRSAPEAQGIASAALLDFVDAADQQIEGMHSLMLVRHGRVVAEGWWTPYNAQSRHELYSLSKSFTSTAVGLAIAEGRMSLDDTVLSCFPGDAPPDPSNHLKAMRLRDLLRMNTGHEKEPPGSRETMSPRSFLAQPVPFKPGTRFLYNTPATFMASAMLQKATGQTLADYLKPRLFDPLGIVDPVWNTNLDGVTLGGTGLSIRTEDIARFGQLYLQKGRWQGKQIVPKAWVEAATALQTSNGSNPRSDWDQGYGYQFWRCRRGAYRGDGAFGQYCIVMPEQDAVLAITSGVKDMQAVLDLVWERLLPAMQRQALPKNPAARARLHDRLARLVLRPQAGTASSPMATTCAGKVFAFPANESRIETLKVESPDPSGDTVFVVRSGGVDYRLRCRPGTWSTARLAFAASPERPVASSGAWVNDDTYAMRLCFYETPFTLSVSLRFAGNQLTLDGEWNVGFGPTRQPQLVATAR